MAIVAFTCIGLLAATLARWLTRAQEPEPGGLLGTTALGIAGALVGGGAWSLLLGPDGAAEFAWSGLVAALGGAAATLSLLRLIRH